MASSIAALSLPRRDTSPLQVSDLCGVLDREKAAIGVLLGGKQIDMPPLHVVGVTFKDAPKANQQAGEQDELEF